MPFGATHSVYGFLRLAKLLNCLPGTLLAVYKFLRRLFVGVEGFPCESASNSLELCFKLRGWLYDKDGKKLTDFSQ